MNDEKSLDQTKESTGLACVNYWLLDHNALYAAWDPYNEMQDETLAFTALHRQRTRLKQILYLTKILPLSIACVHVAAFSIMKHSNSWRRRSSYYKFMSSSFFFIQNATDISPVFLWQSDGKGTGSVYTIGTFSVQNIVIRAPWRPFFESPGNISGPKSNIPIEIQRIRARVLASKLLHCVSLTDSFIMLNSKLLKPGRKQLTGPFNYRDFRETGPWSVWGWVKKWWKKY